MMPLIQKGVELAKSSTPGEPKREGLGALWCTEQQVGTLTRGEERVQASVNTWAEVEAVPARLTTIAKLRELGHGSAEGPRSGGAKQWKSWLARVALCWDR